MDDAAAIYILTLRALAAGSLAAVIAGLARSRVAPNVRLAAMLACGSGLAYFIFTSGFFELTFEPFYGSTMIAGYLSFPVIGLVWLLIMAVFEDWRVRPLTLLPALVTFLLFTIRDASTLYGGAADIALRLVSGGICLHGLWVIARGWRGDLVEARRRLRAPLFLLMTGAVLYVLWQLTWGYVPIDPVRLDTFNAIFETAWAVAAAGILLEGRAGLFAQAPQKAADDRAATADKRALEKLAVLMEQEEAWRREGLTIGALAAEIGVGEQRLRRLINGQLGHRNFASFINGYRITAAKGRLAKDTATVAEIAFDLGFTSLGPFNRAFKDQVGETPTEWRRRAIA